jgi:hypothetical protein
MPASVLNRSSREYGKYARYVQLISVQDETDSLFDPRDYFGMSKQTFVEPTPKINERLWQAWVVKNRELDRRGAARRLRFLKIAVAAVVAGIVLYRYLG